MGPILLTLGLLMVACALTLMWAGSRTWLMAIAQGMGLQAIVAAAVAAIQLAAVMDSPPRTAADRTQLAIQAMPFNAGGWTARQLHQELNQDPTPGVMDRVDEYLPLAIGQTLLIGIIIGARRLSPSLEDRTFDPIQAIIVLLVAANALANLDFPWWQA